jgi:prophage regulatory protein
MSKEGSQEVYMHKFMLFDAVSAATTLKKSEISRRIKEGRFPAPVKVGNRRNVWLEADIQNWMAGLVEARDAAGVENAQEA